MVTTSLSPATRLPMLMVDSIFAISSPEKRVFRIRFTWAISASTTRSAVSTLHTSMAWPTTLPALSSSTSSMARWAASMAFTGSTPLMNRAAASVTWRSSRVVLRMLLPLNTAASNNTALVFSVISLFSPPMTPAMPTPLVGSAISSISSVVSRSLLSRVTTFSPG